MKKLNKLISSICFMFVILFCLSACGQTGRLYLPQDTSTHENPATH